MLTLSLHLSLYRVKGVTNERVCSAVEESTASSNHEFLLPTITSLLIVRHTSVRLIKFN